MLKKLLKYDLKAVFKYWWIAAVSTLGLSVLGGFAVTVLRDTVSTEPEKKVPIILEILSSIALPLVYLGFIALGILTVIMIFVRYYKNFFSDEGYLTFTLPVKKSELINSKVIMGVISSLATSFVVLVNIIIILVIGFFDNIIKPDFWKEFSEFFSEVFKALGVYTFVYVLEIILVVFLANLLSTLFLYDCVAIASMLVKKAKVITAIGIYYVANGVISTLFTIFSLFGMSTIIDTMSAMKTSTLLPLISLLGSGIIVMLAMFTALLYLLQYWIIDRKLNLS